MWHGNFSINKYFFFIGVFLAVLFSSLEPSGSQGLGKFLSLPFWAIHMFIGLSILVYLQKLSFKFGIFKNKPWVLVVLNACVGAILFSLPAHYLDYLFAMPGNKNLSLLSSDYINELGGVFLPVASTWIFINAPWLLQLDFTPSNYDLVSNSDLENSLNKIEPNIKNKILNSNINIDDVIAISSELHYLRVFTTTKQYLILGSLKEVISEFPENLGMQTHRSHWVAKKYFKSIDQTKSGTVCVMENKLTFPVSRRKKSEIIKQAHHLIQYPEKG